MDNKKRVLVTVSIGVVLVIGFYFITGAITKYTGYSIDSIEEKSDFEKCLDEQYIVLYINSVDSSATLRGIEVEEYLQYFDIVNCYGSNDDCVNEGVEQFPTWVINEYSVERDISFSDLIKYSGCKFI